MKLALVTAFPPSKVTLNEYGYHLAKNFAKQEEIDELVLLTDYTEEAKNIDFSTAHCQVKTKDCWKFNSYKNLFNIYKAIQKEKPDVVLFNLQFMKFGDKKVAAALGLLLPMLCRLNGIPNMVLLHNILEQVDLKSAGFTQNKLVQRGYNLIGYGLTKLILQANLVAVTISKYVSILNQKYKAKNVMLIPHGSFERLPLPNFEIPDGAQKIMCFGKFGTYKKVEILIEAVEQLRNSQGLNLEIVIAGTDSPNTPGYLDQVKEKYKNIKQISFTGYVAEADVPRIFEESTMVVFPYTSTTGSSGVLHQAGSYGKAVVLPDLGDLGILVREEGYQGEFFDPQSVDSLANAIYKIARNAEYRKALALANYQAAASLPMDVIAQKYVQAFKQIIPQKAEQVLIG